MTIAQILDQALADVAFSPPVSVDDCIQVRDALRELLPQGTMIEVHCPTQTEVFIAAGNLKRVIPVTR